MTTTSLLTTTLDAVGTAQFDAFMRGSPFAAYQQDRAWAELAPRTSVQDYLYFTVQRDGTLIGAAVIRRTRLAPGTWLGTVQRGPVVHAAEAMETVLRALIETVRDAGCCSLQLSPRVRGRDMPIMAEAMRATGFVPLPESRQPLHSTTGIVWLDKPEEAVLAGFKQRGRRQLKAAEKAGVTVRAVTTPDDIARYQRILDEFRASKREYDMGGLPGAAAQAALIVQLGGAMLLAELDGQVIGGHAFVRQGDEAIWLSLATSSDLPAIPRSYPLLWEGMRAARTLGCIGYDLAGMALGEPRDEGEANRMQFKNAFAPTRRIMPPMQVAALKPLRHAVFFGARQLYRDSALRKRVAAWRGGDRRAG
jgi:lipid II:glycine glycyltransferase (peptidoglycan interpeptide bridge formation enzyme)